MKALLKMKSRGPTAEGGATMSPMGCLIIVIGGFAAIGGFLSLIESGSGRSTWLIILGPILVWVGGVIFFVGRMREYRVIGLLESDKHKLFDSSAAT
jgi:hypothetical protein